MKIGDMVVWYRKINNHRDRYDKFKARVIKFGKVDRERITIALESGELRVVYTENVQVCKN